MELTGRVAVLTGAGHGMGAAMAARFAAAGARGVVVSDLDGAAAADVAAAITRAGGRAVGRQADAASRTDLRALVEVALDEYGRLDVFCSNAGVVFGTGVHASDEHWRRSFELNVLQHVYAAQAALPAMLAARDGYLVITASGAGLLTLPGDAPYSVTKHAAVALAEWLAMTYRTRGIRVSALCPLGVRTPFLIDGVRADHPAANAVLAMGPLIEPEEVADAVLAAMAKEELLILPHPEAGEAYARKAADPDEWLRETAATVANARSSAPSNGKG
ncbi:NAD(P)-dependent dehydrogenase (short-subunit alcohol dehydrogenase family) [Actinokineospora baliensis]|uniref:SDR family oxidoreductase n=1 Tax=Actinokineospora baliensis TaxID=547056 RepID=UPI001957DBB9|nr:SDR family oxidoreductase [Actinokineospora baliensis]MBM7774901.1 NAD(P)-dependent dehydrogenase (short-subunit alcohol dehydrogenase family) [Actinokineospora baliensis]